MNGDRLKKLAAEKAVDEISSGMIVGLGTGSTVQFALEKISEKLKKGELKDIRCIPSSHRTADEAARLGIPLIGFEEALETVISNQGIVNSKQKMINKETVEKDADNPLASRFSPLAPIDITIDGADEVAVFHFGESEGSKRIDLIKGGGGALLREKVLAQNSKRLIIIIDESKMSGQLGEKWAVPVEVIPFAAPVEEEFLKSLDAEAVRRKRADGTDYLTDQNNFILDSNFGIIKNPAELSIILDKRAAIVEHGLFIGLASEVICAYPDGRILTIPMERRPA